jgi:hypothetical protein
LSSGTQRPNLQARSKEVREFKMVMRSWVLKSWPEVLWQLPADLHQGPLFQHMGTEVRRDLDDHGRAVGETVWAARLADDRLIGAAWEWVEVLPGVPAIRDPNGIISNLRLVDDGGQDLEELLSIVGMNRIAHATPWQQAVMRAVRGEPEPPLVDGRKRSARRAGVGYGAFATGPEGEEAARVREIVAALPARTGATQRAVALAG